MSGISGVPSPSYDIWQILTAPPTTASTSTTNTSPSTTATSSSTNSNDPLSNLDLTTSQQQQIEQIYTDLENGSITPSLAQSQLASVLTSQQLATLQQDVQALQAAHHHHHHHGGGSPLAALGLTSDQQSQISQILQNAQTNGTSSSDVLGQIDNVLTPTQQQQLIADFSAYTSTGSSTGSGSSSSTGSTSPVPYAINATV